MFDRLGAKDRLPLLELPKWEGRSRFVLIDEDPLPSKPARSTKPIEASGLSPADRHVAAILGRKPKVVTRPAKVADSKPKESRKTKLTPVMTEDYPRQPHESRRSKIPAAYAEVFSKMVMGGPGIRCPKKHGNVVAARLRQYIVERELLGRAIVQYWDDGDRVFWVAPNF